MRSNRLNKKPCFEKENIRELTEEEHFYRNKTEDFIKTITPHPLSKFSGQGIVICAGGIDLFVNAWLCIKFLKKWKCKLPIEFCYSDNELTEDMLLLLKKENVSCINASHVKSEFGEIK